ncbi:hypothetical protein LO80_00375 [Candidatus Francisella endociliophora]|uniref:Major facilitator superfamily (MFS) profile domain-containing protein n=2 Tax=Candidatus Francisella endociliophora TaxID=653937 RepID=A0A097ELY0_9GAMM|nr:hypothetical protein LO80_00375 [Francisella sp. FSC1006]
MLMMGSSSVLIAFLPGYNYWGYYSIILLVVFRIMQGIGMGAELPNSLSLLNEKLRGYKASKYFSIIGISFPIGTIVASLSINFISIIFTETQINDWAWRLIFLFGGCVAFIIFYARKIILNNIEQEDRRTVARELFGTLRKQVLQIILMVGIIFVPGSLIIQAFFYISYFISEKAISSEFVYFSFSLSLIVMIFSIIFFGYIAEYIGKVKTLAISFIAVSIIAIPLFEMAINPSEIKILMFFIIQKIFVGCMIACYLPLVVEVFPTSISTTASAISYNFAAILASLTPSLLLVLIHELGYSSVGYFYMTITIIGVFFLFFLSKMVSK